MSGVHTDASLIPLHHEPLDPAKVQGPSIVTTASIELGTTNLLKFGVWEHSVGTSTDVEVDEVFVVLSGKGRVFLSDGTVVNLEPGFVGRFVPVMASWFRLDHFELTLLQGEKTRWEIDEPLRKVWVVSSKL